MTTCATCKHWHQPDPLGTPEDPQTMDAYGTCSIARSVSGEPAVLGAPACALDSELYGAALRTLPTFGCARYEATTPPEWVAEFNAAELGFGPPREVPLVNADGTRIGTAVIDGSRAAVRISDPAAAAPVSALPLPHARIIEDALDFVPVADPPVAIVRRL